MTDVASRKRHSVLGQRLTLRSDNHAATSGKCSGAKGVTLTILVSRLCQPGREVSPQSARPLFHVESKLAENCVHHSFVTPSNARAGRGSAIQGDIERLAERDGMEV